MRVCVQPQWPLLDFADDCRLSALVGLCRSRDRVSSLSPPLKMLSHCQMREQMFTFCFVCLCYIETNAAVLCFIWRKCCSGPFFSHSHPSRLNFFWVNHFCVLLPIHSNRLNIADCHTVRLFFWFSQDSVQTNTWNKKFLKNRGAKLVRVIACCINTRKLILPFIMITSPFQVMFSKRMSYTSFLLHSNITD